MVFPGHRFSSGDSPPPELSSPPPPLIGFTGCNSIANDPLISGQILIKFLTSVQLTSNSYIAMFYDQLYC